MGQAAASSFHASLYCGGHRMASERVGLPRGWGAEKDHRPWPLGVLRQLSPSASLRQLQAQRSPECPPGEKGRCQGPASWAVTVSAGDQARGYPPCCPLRASLSHLTHPSPPRLPGSCLGLFLLCPMSSPCSPHPPACPDINECEEDGIECGPSQMCFNTRGSYQCVDTPCPATYRQGSSPG